MTKPLTPAECDLQDFPFMPLHVARLRDSDLAAEASPEACWYAVLLWAAAWHQIPAGSLPDNDGALTRLIGLGRDVRTFLKHKASAMRGFILCDDGRLYHPVVAEQALTAWEGKLQQRWRTECARIKKANQRTGGNLPTPTYEQFLSGDVPDPGPQVVPGDTSQSPSGQSVQEKGTEKGKGTGTETERILEEEGGQVVAFQAPEVGGKPASPRGERLNPDWCPSAENSAYAVAQGFTVSEVNRIGEDFRDFWIGKAGADARKLDWTATWRKWVRTEADRRGKSASVKRAGFV